MITKAHPLPFQWYGWAFLLLSMKIIKNNQYLLQTLCLANNMNIKAKIDIIINVIYVVGII